MVRAVHSSRHGTEEKLMTDRGSKNRSSWVLVSLALVIIVGWVAMNIFGAGGNP